MSAQVRLLVGDRPPPIDEDPWWQEQQAKCGCTAEPVLKSTSSGKKGRTGRKTSCAPCEQQDVAPARDPSVAYHGSAAHIADINAEHARVRESIRGTWVGPAGVGVVEVADSPTSSLLATCTATLSTAQTARLYATLEQGLDYYAPYELTAPTDCGWTYMGYAIRLIENPANRPTYNFYGGSTYMFGEFEFGTLLTDQDVAILDSANGCQRVSFNCVGPTSDAGLKCLSPGLVYALKG